MRTNENNVWIDSSTVISADMMASNGIVHVIDEVLLPPSVAKEWGEMTDRGDKTIAEIAMESDMFTTLVA